MRADVIVIGGGPIGLVAARSAAEHGARTLLLERRAEGASSSCCTGLVSARTLETLGISEQCVLRRIHAARVHVPEREPIELRSERTKAIVVDRTTIEKELLRLSCEAGADIRFQTEAVAAEPGEVRVRTDSTTQRIPTSIVIGADGPRTQVAGWFSLNGPADLIAAAQVELEMPASLDCVDIFVGSHVAPGFFAWGVPSEDGRMRVGIGVTPPHDPGAYLDRLVATQYAGSRIISRCAGWIPLPSGAETAGNGVLLVGDAAAHIKPLSGGGLYFGAACARIAGEIAAKAATTASGHEEVVATYPQRCLDVVGKEQAFGRTLRSYVRDMPDDAVAAIVDALADPSLLQFVADHADIDQLHEIPDRLAAEPGLWGPLMRAAPLITRRLT